MQSSFTATWSALAVLALSLAGVGAARAQEKTPATVSDQFDVR
jgi:hypothetical protein